jgi:CO/xanthine dehydrogenase Mo-binding subunit
MIGSAVPSVAPPISLASRLGPPDPSSRASPRTPQSASQDPLIRKNQRNQHDHNSSIYGASDRQTAASEIAEETIDSSSARTVQAAPELVVPSVAVSTVPDRDVKSRASREPSVNSSKHRVRTKLFGHGPVFAQQKKVLDPRIIVRLFPPNYMEVHFGTFSDVFTLKLQSAQGITFRSCMLVGTVTAILFASIILPMPSP